MEKQPKSPRKYKRRRHSADKGKVLVILTLDVGNGMQDRLEIKQKDNSKSLAANFSKKHKLDSNVQRNLQNFIQEHKNIALKHIQSRKSQQRNSLQAVRSQSPQKSERVGSLDANDSIFKPRPVKTLCQNNGQMIHAKNWLLKKEKLRKLQLVRSLKEEEKDKECTYSPSINNRSQKIVKNRDMSIEDRLLDQGLKKEQKINDLKRKQLYQSSLNMTFTPSLNTRSQMISSRLSSGASVFSDLYKDASERKQRLSELESSSQFSYHPQISDIGVQKREYNQQELIDRLHNSRKDSEKHIQQLVKIQDDQNATDPETKQEWFKPRLVSRSPTNRNRGDNLFDYLFNEKEKYTRNQINFIQQEHLESQQQKSKLSACSAKALDKMKVKQFQHLYAKMDADNKGFITLTDIPKSTLSHNQMKSLLTFFEYLQVKTNVAKDEFMEVIQAIYEQAGMEEKGYLLQREDRNKSQEPSKTRLRKNRSSSIKNFYDRMLQYQSNKTRKVLDNKFKKFEEEINACTFRPKIKKLPESSKKRKVNSLFNF